MGQQTWEPDQSDSHAASCGVFRFAYLASFAVSELIFTLARTAVKILVDFSAEAGVRFRGKW